MELNVLTRGGVGAPAAELVGHFRHPHHLRGSHGAAGDFGPHHLNARLPLAVDTITQAEGAELVVGDSAVENSCCFNAKPLDLLANSFIVLFLEGFANNQVVFYSGRHYGANLQILYRDYPNSKRDASV